jgi:hypothetical protein
MRFLPHMCWPTLLPAGFVHKSVVALLDKDESKPPSSYRITFTLHWLPTDWEYMHENWAKKYLKYVAIQVIDHIPQCIHFLCPSFICLPPHVKYQSIRLCYSIGHLSRQQIDRAFGHRTMGQMNGRHTSIHPSSASSDSFYLLSLLLIHPHSAK